MRLCRFEPDRVGLLDGSNVHDVTPALKALAAFRYPLPAHDVLIEALPGLQEPMLREAQRVRPIALDDVRLISPVLIEFASSYYWLLPGDILLTGTPQGVGPIRSGDSMLARIDQIGSMRVEVEAA